MTDIDPHLADVLTAHPSVAAAQVTADPDGTGGHALLVADPRTAPALHRSAALEAAGRLGPLGWHEPAGALRVAGLNRSETEFLHREIFTDNAYFRHGIALPPAAVVVDVGANIGMFTLRSALHSPGARIIAVEPVTELADAVALNAELYDVDATVLRTALGRADGETDFTFYPGNSVMSGRFADPREDLDVLRGYLLTGQETPDEGGLDRLMTDRMTARTRRVPVTTLTSVAHTHRLDRVDLLKIDVEKAEADVLDGIDDTLWPRIDRVVLEVHDLDGRLAAALGLLRSRGYLTTTDQDPRLTRTPCHNVYARRPGVPAGTASVTLPDRGPTLRRLTGELRELAAARLPSAPPPDRWTLVTELTELTELTERTELTGRTESTDLTGGHRAASGARPDTAGSPRVAVLAGIWADIFGPDAVRPDADFFDLGGDSLTAVRLMTRLEDALGEDALTPDLIFTDSTFGALADAVEASGAPEPTALP
ncbi:FkbM family methyltransferase [Streptomyces sp. NPDC101249]|uniref:FkbM family methyltransferase n=1 Tax=Streptomyces sp. NPDC101249 TaxID=3366140 RepID=UPI0037F3127D